MLFAVPLTGAVAERNRLAGNPSPYLALHADDPVDWRPWGEDAFADARRDGKLLLVSSGYFSCHWCHVMQRESFRDAAIATLINRQFVPVKVDREAAPALDAALLDFARRTRGKAGWPLQVFVTPDGHPLVAATYQPPQEFAALLQDLAGRWRDDAAGLQATARVAAEQAQPAPAEATAPRPGEFAAALLDAALQRADELQGGFGAQSRFPHAPQLLALLEVQSRRPDADLAEFLRLTLRQMATQGLHDELNGGFFRYTVDPDWQTPHFEKLLADNALLARVYLRAATVLDDSAWHGVAMEALDFVLREFAAPGGGYYVALSALDAAGVDGGHYLWSRDELERLSGAHWPLLRRYWGLDRPTPFAEGHLPIPRVSRAQLASEFGLSPTALDAQLHTVYAELRKQRARTGVPVDRQVVAGANGLLLTALTEAATQTPRAEDRARYARAAKQLAETLTRDFIVDGRLVRSAHAPATLEDHAYVAQGLAAWYGSDGGTKSARALLHTLIGQAWARHYRDGRWRLGEDALLRWGGTAVALADSAVPAPPAVLVQVSGALRLETAPREQALRLAWPAVIAEPFEHASWLWAYP